jgi:hypothetical protein
MATSSGKSKDNQASAYKSNKRWESNRTARLERTLKAQPTNQQVVDALKGGLVYRRKTPTTKMWSHSWKKIAQLYKQVTGRFDPDIMSSNPALSQAALSKPGPKSLQPGPQGDPKTFFQLITRNNMRGTN